MSNYNTSTVVLGTEVKVLVVYELVKGYKGGHEEGQQIEPDVPDSVEIETVYLDIEGDGDFKEIDPSPSETEELADEILESLS